MPTKRIMEELQKMKIRLREREKSLKDQKDIIKLVAQTTKQTIHNLKNETKKHLVTAIVAAFGFIIALVWKDTIKEYVNIIVEKFPIYGASQSIISFYTAIITTIIAVIGIFIITRWAAKD